MRTVLFSPSPLQVNGGIKQIFRLAEALSASGMDACVFEKDGHKPNWFETTAKIIGVADMAPNPDEILVLPEDQPEAFKIFKDWPQKKVVYAQNQFYEAYTLGAGSSFQGYGVSVALCCSQTIFDYFKFRHPTLPSFLVPCGIDRMLFKEGEKEKIILAIPRKRPLEYAFLKDLFLHMFPDRTDWRWGIVEDKSEKETADLMSRASVFLALPRLESLGLTALEAMSSGCVIAGYTGIGGREYANDKNGFWFEEEDFEGAARQIECACSLAEKEKSDPAWLAYDRAMQDTLSSYTQETFTQKAEEAFKKLLS